MMNTQIPRATYRLQLNAQFTFHDAAAIAPYLASLGVSHVYASPIQKARPGSMHGYDIVDHSQINPELGGEEGLGLFSRALSEYGLKLLLDIVPNHMGVGGADNPWWMSVLEWGEQSPFAPMFDIDWERIGANRKLVLPFLGQPYGAALRAGELQMRFNADEGSFSVWHWEHRFPINPIDYRAILEWAQVAGGGGIAMRPLYQIAAQLRELADEPRSATQEGRVERCLKIKQDLAAYAKSSPTIHDAIEKAVAFACGDPRTPESFGALHGLLERQPYRLAYWRVASAETNYRRFFDINSLAGLRVEDEKVFAETHALIFRLIDAGIVHGLRIDHIDGLANPRQYLERLRARLGPDFYIVVEKILEADERLQDWPIAGTTGYETMHLLDSVFVAQDKEPSFTALYENVAGPQAEPDVQLRKAKLELLRVSFGSELETLVSDVKRAADADLLTSDFTSDALRRALSEIIAALPVYRTYIDEGLVQQSDRLLVMQAVESAKATTTLDTVAAHELAQSFLLAAPDALRSPSRQLLIDRITRRFQQLTGPVMAKSLEDTLFYRYARFIGLNEVGGDPWRFGATTQAFHAANAGRAEAWPHAMIATATHDMKRGEDVRARLAALSHRPDVWKRICDAAETLACEAPDANDRYMLLQTIIGAWPMDREHGQPLTADETFRARVEAYAMKALRESKRRSSWTAPDEAYEAATRDWLHALFSSDAVSEMLRLTLAPIASAGLRVSLARTVLKLTLPGVPDTYQGCEFDDFSLVDPDNRRPVDYAARMATLEKGAILQGHLKLAITATLLHDRASAPRLYANGDYKALPSPSPEWLCFSRNEESNGMIVAVATDPFCETDPEEIARLLAPGAEWGNLIEGHALEQRKRGGHPAPAIVLRKSRDGRKEDRCAR